MAGERYHGILLLHKPVGMSSHDAIYAVRRAIDQKGGGHTGTLDPLAEGLLVICLGRATKVSRYLNDMDKTYEAVIRLGLSSRTYDAEGVDDAAVPADVSGIDTGLLRATLDTFVGTVQQTVPPFSAVKIDGRPLYKEARKGRAVAELPVRTVIIDGLDLLAWEPPDLSIVMRCSKGTYVRSLADELGQRLGCGAYLSALKRTRVGVFSLDESLTLNDINQLHSNRELEKHLLPLERVLPFAAIEISDELAGRVVQGPPVRYGDVVRFDGRFAAGETVVLKDRAGTCLAVGRAQVDSDACDGPADAELFRYDRVLN
ncbi:MAG: tRNA pseudouridine(55) synthase TruB [candidate division Zixibacteria bacterium]|jgi:tRNA pseudouridine55 synthase|nr:tRNA pseudouridine(55) synthase TruB [candidate division Zixibacteria bacterium]